MAERATIETATFWADVFPRDALARGYLLGIVRRSMAFVGVALVAWMVERLTPFTIFSGGIVPLEFGGAALGVLLALRINAGYDRWWEARRLWGGITNQSRSLITSALAFGPDDPLWRSAIVRWTIVFAHAARRRLRGELEFFEIAALVGDDERAQLSRTNHPAIHATSRIASLLKEADKVVPSWALLQIERERMTLIDHMGGCERIAKTPFPRGYTVSLRQFVFVFLVVLPVALVPRIGWLTPIVTFFVAFPLLALDQIAADLKSPFVACTLNGLPLDEICETIEADLLALLAERGNS